MPQVAAAIAALDPARLRDGRAGGRQLRRPGARDRPRRRDSWCCSRSTATRWSARARTRWRSTSSSTTSCAARGSRARSCTPSRRRARTPASTWRTASRSTLGGDEELLAAAREHEDYVTGETLATSARVRRRAGRGAARRDRGRAAVVDRRLGWRRHAAAAAIRRASLRGSRSSAGSWCRWCSGSSPASPSAGARSSTTSWSARSRIVGRLPRRHRAPRARTRASCAGCSAGSSSAASSCSATRSPTPSPKADLPDPQGGLVFVTTLVGGDPRRPRRRYRAAP